MGNVGKLVVIAGMAKGMTCEIKEGEEISIGRNLSCTIPMPDIRMSKIHCIVRNIDGKFEILDNNSSNGTYMNGKKVEICAAIRAGDIIEVGDTQLEFSIISVHDNLAIGNENPYRT